MAGQLDNCRFNATSSGTVDFVYNSTVSGYQSPAAANAVTALTYEYYATDGAGAWEIGLTTLTISGGPVYTFARTTVYYNSAGTGSKTPGQSGAGSKISFGSAPQVAIVAVKESLLLFDEASAFTAAQQLQARTNLGMSTEIGKIEMWPMSDIPASRLKCNGASYNRSTYPDLSAYLIKTGAATFTNASTTVGMTAHGRSVNDPIKLFTSGTLPTNFTAGTHGLPTVGTNYFIKTVIDANNVTLSATAGGAAITAGSAGSGSHTWVCAPSGDGDGSTTFTVPELRGEFARFIDDGRAVDSNRSIMTAQLDAFQGHWHTTSNANTALLNGDFVAGGSGAPTGTGHAHDASSDGVNGTPRTAAETRPRNIALTPTIRYAA